MALWINCHSHSGKPIFINIDAAATIAAIQNGSRIAFPGGPEDIIDVTETPDEVLTLRANAAVSNA